jgi:hypothetical protein
VECCNVRKGGGETGARALAFSSSCPVPLEVPAPLLLPSSLAKFIPVHPLVCL